MRTSLGLLTLELLDKHILLGHLFLKRISGMDGLFFLSYNDHELVVKAVHF